MSSEHQTILIIESDKTNIELLEGMLEEEFTVRVVDPGPEATESVAQISPDALIINPQQHPLDLLTVCETLKDRNPKAYILYMDESESLTRQVDAFDAGCDDYIPKPFNPLEVYHKIKTNILLASRSAKLADQANQARNMAFTVMEANSELGTILRFIEQVITTRDYEDLGQALEEAGDNFGIYLAVQLRTHVGNLNVKCQPDSDIVRLLDAATLDGRIIENGRRLILSRKHVAFFATKLPADEEKYGRLKDNLAILMNAAEAKMTSLIVELSQDDERETLINDVISKVLNSMTAIQHHYENHESDIHHISREFKDHLETILMAIDLDEKQEEALLKSVHAFLDRMMDTEATKNLIQDAFKSLLMDLKKVN
ncbi:MAG: response regulator [Ketobacteraceae bacterium]|nr:response regulator [Ketobacteraceae bacterium]